jgi:hypothetical protein
VGSATGPVCGTKRVTVVSFNPAAMILTQGGNYGFVGNSYTVPGGVAVSYSSSATIHPSGVDCSVPQLTTLRVGIMQESSNFIITTTYDSPTITWAPGVPSGFTVTVPTSLRFTTSYDPSVAQPVNDGLAGASPLYSKAPAALRRSLGCPGGAAATSNDTPSHDVTPTLSLPFVTVGTVTWTLVNTTRREHFRTFCVIFNTSTNQFCALLQAVWDLNVDSLAANQHATVTSDTPATANPAVGVQANSAPTTETTASVAGDTTITKP